VGTKLNGTNHLLSYAENFNVVKDNTDIVKKNTETLIHGSKEFGIEIDENKTKCMLVSRDQITRALS
jgi:hypothetical protein